MMCLGLSLAALTTLLLVVNCAAYYRDRARMSRDERAKQRQNILDDAAW